MPMRTVIDRRGRIVVPKILRDRLGLQGCESLEIDGHDGVIEIRVSPVRVRVAKSDGALIAMPFDDVRPIGDASVSRVRGQTGP